MAPGTDVGLRAAGAGGLIELDDLGFDEGAHLLVKRALAADGSAEVRGRAPTLAIDLPAWCRSKGHAVERRGEVFVISRGPSRWTHAARAGEAARPSDRPDARWGLAARGALVEAGAPALDLPVAIWADEAARLYAQAAAAQWDPATAIPWDAPATHPPEVEDAVVQVMTYLIENETAALLVPVKFLARLNPHYREVMQLMAIQAADEARHVEVFTRRALLRRPALGTSAASGQASLATLFDHADFAVAAMLLAVLGEGSFLSLLWFLRDHAPDACTRELSRLAAQDEARHVAFGLAHVAHELETAPALRGRLATAIEERHGALAQTSGLGDDVFDALVLLAAGEWTPAALRRGHAAVVELARDMHAGRKLRLSRLGFADEEAERLSSLHTRNFM